MEDNCQTVTDCNSIGPITPTHLTCILPETSLTSLAQDWLKEDTPGYDLAGAVVGSKTENCVLLCKSVGVLCGRPFFDAIFKVLDCHVDWKIEEGSLITEVPCRIAEVTGPACAILRGERPALNCIARASGIATHARKLRDIKNRENWHGEIAGTRKTTPGFRLVEKYSLLVGGISAHRYDLSSMVMLKDNHIWSMGSITAAVKQTRSLGGFCIKIEVEASSLEEAREAASCGADVVMLDNWTPESAKEGAKQLKCDFPHLILECSGGIKKENCHEYFSPVIDVISMSSTTQGYGIVDFSLKIDKHQYDITNPTIDRLV